VTGRGNVLILRLRQLREHGPSVDPGIDIEPIKLELERVFARLSSWPPGEDSTATLEERLERVLDRYAAFVEKRDSTLPPKRTTETRASSCRSPPKR